MRISKPPHQRKAELIAAARLLFDQKGIDKTRVSDIVRRVGVAQGVFYYYFASKEEMVEAVVRQVSAEVEAKADAILSSKEAFSARLADFIELYIHLVDQFLGDDETSIKALADREQTHRSPALQAQGLLGEKFYQFVGQAAERGELSIAYPVEAAKVLLFGLRKLATEKLPTRPVIYAIAEQTFALPRGALSR